MENTANSIGRARFVRRENFAAYLRMSNVAPEFPIIFG